MNKLSKTMLSTGKLIISPAFFVKNTAMTLLHLAKNPIANYKAWKEIDVKWRTLTIWSMILLFSWISFGCGAVNQEFVRQIEIKTNPVLIEFLDLFENGHSWEGIDESDRAEQTKIREDQIKSIRDYIQENKK